MSPLKLPFGLRDGRLYEPRHVDAGLACRCVCPSCGEALIAKHGDSGKIRPHFAHAAGAACDAGFESAVHLAAKQLIEERRELFFPEHRCHVQHRAGSQWLEAHEVLEDAGVKDVRDIEVEKAVGRLRPDLTVRVADRRYIIEIAFTHFVDDDKLQRLRVQGDPALEFDVSDLRVLDFALLEERLFTRSARVKWIYHPETAACESRLRVQLEPQIARAQQAYAEAQRARLVREAQQESARVARWASRAQDAASRDKPVWDHPLEGERAAAFAALPTHQKRERALAAMNLPREAGGGIFGLKVRSSSIILAPADVWQSALFAMNIDRCQQHKRPYLTVDHATAWLSRRFKMSSESGKPEVAVWDYLQALANLEILEWKPRKGFLVMVADAHAAIALATFNRGTRSHRLTWQVREVPVKRRVRLAEAFAMNFGAGSFWRGLVSPDFIERYDDPVDFMLAGSVQCRSATAVRRFLIAAGFCGTE